MIDVTTLVVTAQLATFDFSYENHKVSDTLIGKITDTTQQDVAVDTFDSRQTAGNILKFKVTPEPNFANKYNVRVVINDGEYLLQPETSGEDEGYYVLEIGRNTKLDVYYDPINIIITTEIHGIPSGCHVQINTANYSSDTLEGRPSRMASLAMTDVTLIINANNENISEIRVVVTVGDTQEMRSLKGVTGNKYVSNDWALLKEVSTDISIAIYFF